jgi:hypothetical protein
MNHLPEASRNRMNQQADEQHDNVSLFSFNFLNEDLGPHNLKTGHSPAPNEGQSNGYHSHSSSLNNTNNNS